MSSLQATRPSSDATFFAVHLLDSIKTRSRFSGVRSASTRQHKDTKSILVSSNAREAKFGVVLEQTYNSTVSTRRMRRYVAKHRQKPGLLCMDVFALVQEVRTPKERLFLVPVNSRSLKWAGGRQKNTQFRPLETNGWADGNQKTAPLTNQES